mmetsp:Transcript_9234/g.19912  ORF Transcript_9234/g.19912 Transcript_9234/m.19912 type:complete len:284 (-) Transcript_9234:261-1112(-)|eukprot:CAMPEP_0168744736 /NCGR_PEP_ID=MMETSP0724-20121128/14248_1 /TAXON_ID=265536 /ORGANISM="Amphiprora sp., Strain CCMP467" /LENGTH=283 /DNA_ID=CAMNT_0008792411 /DNA_START=133 /DNA_END=984 /DNA_ORIENTATION=+
MNAFTAFDMTTSLNNVDAHDVAKAAMTILRSPVVEVAATLFTIGYPLGVVLSLRRDESLTARQWRRFRRGAELGAWMGFLMQQILCYSLVFLQHKASSSLWGTLLGAVIYSPAVIPILSMICLLLVTCPLACKTHVSLNLYWIGALCTALVQQGLWMALSLGFYFKGDAKLHFNEEGIEADADYSHMAWVVLLGFVPIGLMKVWRRRQLSRQQAQPELPVQDEEEQQVIEVMQEKELLLDEETYAVSTEEGDDSSYASSSSEEDDCVFLEDSDKGFLYYQRLV